VKTRVCRVDELDDGEMVRVEIEPPIAVYNVEGEFFATSDVCTHMVSSLTEDGYLDGCVVECGWHMAKFDVKTGALLMPPGTEPLKTYVVEVSDDEIFVEH